MAFPTLEQALAAAPPLLPKPVQIWVAIGVYTPSSPGTDPRAFTFSIPDDTELWGGFLGNESMFANRAGLFDRTILSGDLGIPVDPTDNARRVVTLNNVGFPPSSSSRAVIDGFMISAGNNDDPAAFGGAGIASTSSNFLLKNCALTNNYAAFGAGVMADGGQPAAVGLTVIDCTFANNTSTGDGAGLWINPVFTNDVNITGCTFRNNFAGASGGDGDGGGLYTVHDNTTYASSFRVTNCLFHTNTANRGGGVFFDPGGTSGGAFVFDNNTLAYNTVLLPNDQANGTWVAPVGTRGSGSGGGLYLEAGPVGTGGGITNCVFWENRTVVAPVGGNTIDSLGSTTIILQAPVSNCDVQTTSGVVWGDPAGTTNILADPLFVNPAGSNYRIGPGSPCCDAGDATWLPWDFDDLNQDGLTVGQRIPVDILGFPASAGRELSCGQPGQPGPPDMGAYEAQ
jgi:hypothetical protein